MPTSRLVESILVHCSVLDVRPSRRPKGRSRAAEVGCAAGAIAVAALVASGCEAPTPPMEPETVFPPSMLVPETTMIYHQGLADPAAYGNEPNDNFAWATATGDFNCDGVQDMAVGIPSQRAGSVPGAGAVAIFYGDTLSPPFVAGPVLRATPYGPAQANAMFGYALAAGRFDGDACDDLAIGAPFEDVQAYTNAGRVYVRYGDASPSTFSRGVRVGPTYSGTDHVDDWFGKSLAAGNFDGDGYDDLAVGAPGTNYGITDGGYVHVRHGSTSGLNLAAGAVYGFGPKPAGSYCVNMFFGMPLAVGNFDGDSSDDLAIGAWGCDDGRANEVYVRRGGTSGLRCSTAGCYDTVSSGTPNPFDYFGIALAAGDLQGDGADDLVVGNIYVEPEAMGQVEVFRGYVGIFPPDPDPADVFQQPVDVTCPIEPNGYFGETLAVGDFDFDGVEDIAIGVPRDDSEVPHDGGTVAIRSGAPWPSFSATREAGYGCVPQETLDTTLADEWYGFSIAAVDLVGGPWNAGPVDLLVGAPHQDQGFANSGVLFVTTPVPRNDFPFTGQYVGYHDDATLRAILVELYDDASGHYIVSPYVYVESGFFELCYWNCHPLHADEHCTSFYAGDTVISGGQWQLDAIDYPEFSGIAQSQVDDSNAIGMGTTGYKVEGDHADPVTGQYGTLDVSITSIGFEGSVDIDDDPVGEWWVGVTDVNCQDYNPTSLHFERD